MARKRHVYCRTCDRCIHCNMRRSRKRRRTHNVVLRTVSSRRVRKRPRRRAYRPRSSRRIIPTLSCASTQMDSPRALSSLFVSCNQPKCRNNPLPDHKEITPEMIHESIRELSMWRGAVDFQRIVNYIQTHYPVAKNPKYLQRELSVKLHVAQLAGICHAEGGDRWALNSSLVQLRRTPQTMVTLFWQLYCDTLDPFKIRPRMPKPKEDKKENSDSDSLPSLGINRTSSFI